MVDVCAKVKIKGGKGFLHYQDFFKEDLNDIRISCIALYSDINVIKMITISCNGSVLKFRSPPVYNVIGMASLMPKHKTTYMPECLELPLTITPKELQFRILNEEDKTKEDFDGYLLIKLSGRFKKNQFV